MIRRQEKPYTTEEITAMLHPIVREWFFKQFTDYSPPQYYSIINIHKRINTLISSPTGSGKTLSAFLAILNDLVTRSLAGTLEERVYAIYLSPLKALGNDIQRNLLEPLAALDKLAEKKTGKKLGIRVGVRTGDTTASEKAKMLRKPPHILITTPESLGIMLTTQKFSAHLHRIDWLIVDEIHALAENKRGVHLNITMERLERLTPNYCRIALSATVSPLEEVARFLVGNEEGEERDCQIVDTNYTKNLDLKVLSPVKSLIREEYDKVADKTYELINNLVKNHKTTLIFTNTRSATERVVHNLKTRYPSEYARIEEVRTGNSEQNTEHGEQETGDEQQNAEPDSPNTEHNNLNAEHRTQTTDHRSLIAAHHGSLSKQHRLEVEEQLKAGTLKVVVSSTSLELGIDIGSIDLVILLSSPKSVARALQRIGRSGHQLHETAKGRIIVQDRDDLVECAVLLKNAIEGKIDKIRIPTVCLDVLAQQLLGIALEGPIKKQELYKVIKKSYCYKNLKRTDFEKTLDYLSGAYVSLEHRHVYAKLWQDEETGMVGKKGKLARLIYMTNSGTIPDETNVKVKIGGIHVGLISEPFLERLRKGDIFVLGGETYEFTYAQGLTANVKSAIGRRPTVPSWHSEMLPLAYDLAVEIQKFRMYMDNYLRAGKNKKELLKFIDDYLYVDTWGASSIYEYFKEQHDYAEIAHKGKLIIEHYNDGRNNYALFHSLYGRRTNDVLARATAYVISKIHQKDVEISISDNGFSIRTTGTVQAARAMRLLRSDELRQLAERSLEKSEVLARRFRHCAARALMILRNYKGQHKSVGKQQMSSRLLLSTVRQTDPDFVILKEARREVLEDLMDIEAATEVVKEIEAGKIMLKEINTTIPTPFAFNLILSGYTDILKMQDRQAFLRKMHELVLAKISLHKDADNELIEQAKHNPTFDYDEYWGEEKAKKKLTKAQETDKLLQTLKNASIKVQLDANIQRDLQELIMRRNDKKSPTERTYKYRKETIAFVKELLTGTVPKIWTDELVQLLKKELPEMEWKERN